MNRRGSRIGIVDVLVLVGVIALAVPIGAMAIFRSREGSGRVPCASNLRQIGLAIQMYANDNKGNFPRTTFAPDPDPVPTSFTGVNAVNPFAAGGPAPNDVSAGLFLILRTQGLPSEVFICPYDTRARRLEADFSKVSNFPGRQNLSYSYQNPYPSKAARDAGFKLNFTLSSDFALASDMNPGGPQLTQLTSDSPRSQMQLGNSNNHNGDGQNVLYADGHVEFQNTPFCGMARLAQGGGAVRDNIFTAGGPNKRHPVGPAPVLVSASLDELDSVLLPVAPEGPSPISATSEPSTGAIAVALGVLAAVTVLVVAYAWRSGKPGLAKGPVA